jgi:Zn-dependent protease with chaperone function
MDDSLEAKCSCLQCGNHIAFPLELAESTVDCPHCGQPTQLSLAPPPTSSPDHPSAAELLNAFGGPVRRTRTGLFYQLGLVLVAGMMVILPLIYIAMIGVAAYGVYYYATHFSFMLKSMVGGVYLYMVKVLAYFTPLFVGVVLVFFMIKPLFARRPPRAQPMALDPAINSTLYAFIARICESVGAPMPRRIDLNCDLNAAAGFRRGIWSLFSNDLVLTIGVPLVACLNLREFAGVMAHEFGHFTQGFGLRLSYIIRTINLWFARVVYERDAWDVMLIEWAEEAEDWRIVLVASCARFGVWCSRLLLMLLMFIGHGVSCFLLRQMEYDADSHEIKLAGSEATEATIKRLNVLGEALRRSYKDMRSTWNTSEKLPENFPAYLAHQHGKLSEQVRTHIEDRVGLARTRLFDSHPSDGDRIRRARQEDEPGIFHLELPAAVLFANFEVVAKQITMLHYNDDLGLGCHRSNLRPMEFYTRVPST